MRYPTENAFTRRRSRINAAAAPVVTQPSSPPVWHGLGKRINAQPPDGQGGGYAPQSRVRSRIWTRPVSDPAVAEGMRNIHRDTRGKVIGGELPAHVDETGKHHPTQFLNSKNRPIDGSSLGNPSTPGLDRQAAINPVRTTAAPAGSKLLADRQALHKDMLQAGKGGLTPEMEQRAGQLGVTQSAWRRVAGKMVDAPAMLAAPGVTAPSPLPPSPLLPPSEPKKYPYLARS